MFLYCLNLNQIIIKNNIGAKINIGINPYKGYLMELYIKNIHITYPLIFTVSILKRVKNAVITKPILQCL